MNPPGMAAEKRLCGREVSVQAQAVRVAPNLEGWALAQIWGGCRQARSRFCQGSHRKRSEGNWQKFR